MKDWPEIKVSYREYRRITGAWMVRYGIPWPLSWIESAFMWLSGWCEEAAWRIRAVGEEHSGE